MATHSSILAWRILMDRGAWGEGRELQSRCHKESDTTEVTEHTHVQSSAGA